jgi:putative oxidoreductase
VNGWDWRYVFRLVLGGVFLASALGKIADPAGFARDIHNYHMLPLVAENVFALVLPWIELLTGLALVFNHAPKGATLLGGTLLVVFLIAIAQAVVRNLDIDCGCFGTKDASQTGWLALLRDFGFLVLALLGWPRGGRSVGHARVETA